MIRSRARTWFVSLLAVLGLFFGFPLNGKGDEPGAFCSPRCVEDLKKLSGCQLHELFTKAEMGPLPLGDLDGTLIYVSDKRLPKVKMWASNLVWRGKFVAEDGSFVNRWIGNRRWIRSHYVVGPSWVDGRLALIMEYPPGSPLFANMHDEFREVAPGLYLGILFERCPCPKYQGFIVLQVPCQKEKCWR